MLDFPIIDTHLHLWDLQRISYPWLADIPVLNKTYLLAEYNQACKKHQVDKMVFLQCEADCNQYKDEADWVSGIAQNEPRIQGIVPWAPLEHGKAARDAVAKLAQNPLVKGIRRIIQFESNPAWCLQPDFVAGVQMLSEFDLHFEICIKGAQQTENTLELVRRCPDVKFILNHIGKPHINVGELRPWQDHILQFASMTNVWCKMSGLVVEADMANWTADDLRPYVNHVLNCFDFDRVMFGGDWPVVVQAAELHRWIDVLDEITTDRSDFQRRQLFRETASQFYRLGK